MHALVERHAAPIVAPESGQRPVSVDFLRLEKA
jgi:hypothetical protein